MLSSIDLEVIVRGIIGVPLLFLSGATLLVLSVTALLLSVPAALATLLWSAGVSIIDGEWP